MRTLISLFAVLALAGAAQAAEPKPGSQQERMKSCNKEAKERALKGGERKSFMSACLKGEKAQ